MLFNRLSQKADEDLMRLVQGGSERALTELYRRYSQRLLRYFFRMLWREEEKAQDFLHDLFLRIIERPAMFDVDRRFSTWIYSVAFNMCKNEYRKQAIAKAHHGQVKVNGSHETEQPDLDHREFQKRLERVLEAEEDDKNLFVLRYELELSLAEIAAILNCPEGTVKSKLFYLKKRLSQRLQVYNPAFN